MKNDLINKSLELHKKIRGKLNVLPSVELVRDNLKLLYSPGVAAPSLEIKKDVNKIFDYTIKSHTVGIITNGTAVLGLGDIGPDASLPVMEGKALLLKYFTGIDAFPICINEKDPKKLVEIIKKISSQFGAINLEDIKAPDCFYVEEKLKKEMNIPVFHDDQHGTAIAILSGIINIEKIIKKKIIYEKTIVCGVGAAGNAIINLLHSYGFKNIVAIDKNGPLNYENSRNNIIFKNLIDNNIIKNSNDSFEIALKEAKIFIGVSKAGLLTKEMVNSMKKDPIIFALANPEPEISQLKSKELGLKFYACGASVDKNQINNFLVFPGVLLGMINSQKNINQNIKINIAKVIASQVTKQELSKGIFIPNVYTKSLHKKVAEAFNVK